MISITKNKTNLFIYNFPELVKLTALLALGLQKPFLLLELLEEVTNYR